MKFSLSKYVLIGSLRTRIVFIILLLTIGVQLAFYAVVKKTNQDLHQSQNMALTTQLNEVVPALVEAEYQSLDNNLLRIQNDIHQGYNIATRGNMDRSGNPGGNETIAIIKSLHARYLSAIDRQLVLRSRNGSLLYTSQSKLADTNITPGHAGFFHRDGSYFTSTTLVEFFGQEYWLTVAADAKNRVLPAVERIAQVESVVQKRSGSASEGYRSPGSVSVAIRGFSEASIVSTSTGKAQSLNLINRQDTRLKILLASSLAIVVILGMALANELTKPLQLLVEATKKIKNGDYAVKVPVLYRDEIGELAETIDLMREHVGEREDEILKLAYADSLTGLPNRALFDDRLNSTVELGKRKDEAFAVLILDMDRFKYINDVLGHESGDHVLKEVAARLKTTLRLSDTVARLGGDEFALLLQDITEDDILAAVGRVAQVFDQPVTLNNQPIDIGCSVGIAKFPQHGSDASTLLRRADMAMYSAKRSDKVYAFYDLNCDEHREEHLSLLSEIKRAIELDELQLFFQPKITFEDSSIFSVETLLRWQHPNRGLIPPDEFIPFAEQTGAIRLITRWLIAKAMLQARLWREQGLVVKMSLNISARDLLDPDFSSYIKNRLDENEVEPAMICMEITESALMEDPIKARRTVEELHELGVSISIDDYGTGYSSLAYVKNLPVNELKIDREFIKNMLENKEDVAIVRSTIELGHNLGLKVVAEGIEREEEMQMLREFGCDQAQGYLISRALTASDMERWISENRKNPTDYAGGQYMKSVGQN